MNDAEFGTAQLSDIDRLLQLYAELRPHDPAYAQGEAEQALGHVLCQRHIKLVVARVDGEAVATCMLALVANFASGGRPWGIIEHVVTTASHHGRGIGRGLLRYALDLAWQENCCKVVLLSGSQRQAAHRLYESAGFDGDRERGFVAKAPDLAGG